MKQADQHLAPCLLDLGFRFRCAVYAVGTLCPEPDLLKWRNWKKRPPAVGTA